ncbi:diaminopimelate epimerase [Sinorhizobium meliloti]|uniref:diaminopimelate epimerase n=1 Tax=Rhizobium meliloti TaxID=382 RepID=UPI000FD8C4E5|nr:diaminopimelate epimerase [Sinorhizobium meliloti]MDW9924839.1 diaminopimelate epimerase [Sinorhizobium meliloti]MDX0036141.1 diaminopimelate epimerase [Sinorhizobium meliloti]RVK27931.1 diaminopimelate epimerase [Sinorhizobium meliloti]
MKYSEFLAQPSQRGLPHQWPFVKMHGLENYFVIIDRRPGEKNLTSEDIVRICSNNLGVGGEQLLTIESPTEAGKSSGAYARLRIYNTDGTEVGACGNATRCIAYLLLEETGNDELSLELGSNIVQCKRAGELAASVTLGPISMDWQQVPLSHEVDTLHLPVENGPLKDGVGLYIGNPHAVFFVDNLDGVDMSEVAPPIHHSSLFSEGANVGAAEIVDDQTIRLSVWERQGIVTRACGTGACVAVYAATKRGLVSSRKVAVHLPAGKLDIELIEGDRALMTGPVAFCCYGYIAAGQDSSN